MSCLLLPSSAVCRFRCRFEQFDASRTRAAAAAKEGGEKKTATHLYGQSFLLSFFLFCHKTFSFACLVVVEIRTIVSHERGARPWPVDFLLLLLRLSLLFR